MPERLERKLSETLEVVADVAQPQTQGTRPLMRWPVLNAQVVH